MYVPIIKNFGFEYGIIEKKLSNVPGYKLSENVRYHEYIGWPSLTY